MRSPSVLLRLLSQVARRNMPRIPVPGEETFLGVSLPFPSFALYTVGFSLALESAQLNVRAHGQRESFHWLTICSEFLLVDKSTTLV